MTSLEGKIALVTGASEGIGAAIAEKLVQEGATVIGCARNMQKIQDISEKLKGSAGSLYGIKCDLLKEDNILSMFWEIKEKYGGLDICINNAGTSTAHGSLIDGKPEDWKMMTDLNVIALSICTKEALQLFDIKGSVGHVVNIGSLAGHEIPRDSSKVNWYCATKWMVRTLTECLRMELREKGKRTRVTHISPGYVRTELPIKVHGESFREFMDNTESLTSEQIADSVLFALKAEDNMEVNDIIIRRTAENLKV